MIANYLGDTVIMSKLNNTRNYATK